MTEAYDRDPLTSVCDQVEHDARDELARSYRTCELAEANDVPIVVEP